MPGKSFPKKRALGLIALTIVSILVVAILIWPERKSGAPLNAGERPNPPSPASNQRTSASTTTTDWTARIAAASLRDLRALIQEALRLENAEQRVRVLAEIISAWMNRDARDFRRYFDTLEVLALMNAEQRDVITAALKIALTKLSAEAAMSDHVLSIVERFIGMLAKSDPAEALRWANEWLMNDARDNALVSVARAFAATQPQQAISVAGQIGNALRKMQAQAAIAEAWSKTEPEKALGWASSLPQPTERAMALNAALLSIAQTDPGTAASRLTTAQQQLAQEYAARRQADLANAGMTEADLANDPATYKEMLASGAISPSTSPDIELLADAARVIASKLAEMKPADALAWADSLGSDFLKLKSMTGLVAGWARTEPEAAFAFYQQRLSQFDEVMTAVFENWSSVSPEQAASGARQINDPAKREVAMETVVSRWASTGDVMQAAAFVDSLPLAERSDAIQLALVQALESVSPELAWKRATMITDETLSFRALKSTFAVLASEQPSLAKSLLASARLPQRYADRLTDMLRAVDSN